MFFGPPDLYSDQERGEIVAQAKREGLEALRCPRDGTVLTIYSRVDQEAKDDEPPVGVRFGSRWVERISVECRSCGRGAAHLGLAE